MAAEAHDGAGGGLLVLCKDVAPLLSVELLRERRRADEIAEAPRRLPHFAQKRRSARLSWSQDGQRIAYRLAWGDYHAKRERRNAARLGTGDQLGIRRSGHFGRK